MISRYTFWVSFYLSFFFFCFLSASAQKRVIKGQIKNKIQENLDQANIIVVDSSTTIIAYSISDAQGKFKLEIPAHSPTKLWIEVSFLGYKTQRKLLEPDLQFYNFVLSPASEVLSEVIIKNRPVLKRLGDTLRYEVERFAQPEDRSIGDVLKRVPGIDIAEDGTIYYNGKKIENLYIHGDDLMSGRYGLATKVIRKEDIKAIDVMRNHQPIKVLKDKIFSDKTAINLVLKDEDQLKLSAQLMTGGGLPKQYDGSITPIVLSKPLKMLNTLALNNSGVDYRDDFKQLGGSNFTADIGTDPTNFSLALGTVGAPDLPVPTYYFNRSKLIDLNNLYNTKNGVQFKVNIQGYWDRNSLDYRSKVDNFTATDTITYNETQELVNKPKLLYTSFNILSNKEKYYLNDNIKVNLNADRNSAFMHFNTEDFPQQLHKNQFEISNDFNWMPQLKNSKGVGEIRWLINYNNQKQKLRIGEGYHAEIPGQEGFYSAVHQSLRIPTLFSNAYISYKLPGKFIKEQYKLGFINEHQQFDTALDFFNGPQSSPYLGDVGNNLKWNRQNLYAKATYQLEYKNWRSTVSLPLAYQTIHYRQSDYDLDSKNHHLLFTPSFNLKYEFNVEERLSLNYSHQYTFGNIAQVFRGAVLRNYRALQANHADIQRSKADAFNLGYRFEKSVSLFFLNVGFNYHKTTSNTIFSTEISEGIQRTILLPFKNSQNSYGFNLGLNKYVFALGSTLSIDSKWGTSTFQQIINDELLPFRTQNFSLSSKFDKKLFGFVRVLYEPHATWLWSKLENPETTPVHYNTFRLDQSLELQFTPIKSWEFKINAKHSLIHQQDNKNGYLFSGANIRHHFKKQDVDLNLDVTNLFNIKDYKLYSISNNQLLVDQYRLRGRMIMLRLNWYF